MRDGTQGSAGIGWGIAALIGCAGFVLAVGALHHVQPELRPATEAVSYYVHGPHGGWLTVGLLSLGLGSLALAILLAGTCRGRGARFVPWGVGLWGACVIAGALFPADPRGRWSEPPSLAGIIHGGAALAGFVALPLAALALGRGLRDDARWRSAGARLIVLGGVCLLSLLAFFASLWPALGGDGPPILLGLTERVLLAAYVAWLSASAIRGMRVAAGSRMMIGRR